jgi:hypothetical protein
MAADPIVYCLEQLTDYEQFERLCHDMMALDGYRGIEPLGGSKDKGRDAIHVDASSNGTVTLFAYSVRDDWHKKLKEDSDKIRKHGHACQRLAFMCTAPFTATERDKAVEHIRTTYGWTLQLYGLERLRTMLATTHRHLVAQHPQIFCPPFFPVAGGLSLAFSPDHLVIDHVDSDAALAHWLARRLTLAGYHVWCRGLAPLAGSSVIETIRGLLTNRTFRYICILSAESLADPDFTARRNIAQAVGLQRGEGLLLPALAKPIEENKLDQETRRLAAARFTQDWASGLKDIETVLAALHCPRKPEGARELAIRSYFPADFVLGQPEILASNLFRVVRLPPAIQLFSCRKDSNAQRLTNLAHWGHRQIDESRLLSFHYAPGQIAKDFGIVYKERIIWNTATEICGIRADDLIKELIKKSLYAECRRRGLHYCDERDLTYFPFGLLKHDHLPFRKMNGEPTFFNVAGERTHGKGERARKFRYHIAPVFVPKEASANGYEIIVRVRLRLTDADGKLFSGRTANSRRKKICKSWWNEEWLSRTMGVMQFLSNGGDRITIGSSDDEMIVIDPQPRTWEIPVRLNEEALVEAIAIRQEEEPHMRDQDEEDDDD